MPPEETDPKENGIDQELVEAESEAGQDVELETNKVNPKDPLHGVTLEALLTSLVEQYGWETLANVVPIRCFQEDPSISSSLKFLRKNQWAREKVEHIYITNDVRPAWKRRGRGTGRRGN